MFLYRNDLINPEDSYNTYDYNNYQFLNEIENHPYHNLKIREDGYGNTVSDSPDIGVSIHKMKYFEGANSSFKFFLVEFISLRYLFLYFLKLLITLGLAGIGALGVAFFVNDIQTKITSNDDDITSLRSR